MLDPIPPPAPWLFSTIKPYADALGLPTFPFHVHEVLFALVFYQTIESIVSPVFSSYVFPNVYNKLNRSTRINWDVHVVSMVQSCLINTLALWVMFTDQERKDMNALERVYGYTGACGLIQGLAAGYFLWDIVVSTRYYGVFGLGIWAHAVSAFFVFSLGFRPYCNYYGPSFILYELSSPFLNIHWFCDKLNLSGSKIQWLNGVILIVTFFGCRLLWGTYSSLQVYQDTWAAMHLNTTTPGHLDITNVMHNFTTSASSIFTPRDGQLCLGDLRCVAAAAEVMQFAGAGTQAVPWWLAIIYLTCNVLLNSLNFYWFGRMIETVWKRFNGTEDDESEHETKRRRSNVVEEAATRLEKDVQSGHDEAENARSTGTNISDQDDGTEINRRRKDL